MPATKSSAMMPIAPGSSSALPTKPSLVTSKNRNNKNAQAICKMLLGLTGISAINSPAHSSITIHCGSFPLVDQAFCACCSCLSMAAHAHSPTRVNPRARDAVSAGEGDKINQNARQASEPKVPGALGANPEKKPLARQKATGVCLNMI